jgi:hypothetical protein
MYFNRRGRFRGFSLRASTVWWLVLLWWLCLPLLAIFWYFPRAVWRLQAPPAVRFAIIAVVWGGLGITGAILGAREASQAQARGCISLANLPTGYVNPTGINGDNCPDGYVPGANYYSVNPTPIPPPSPPSLTAQQAACAGRGGAETEPDFPPPIYDQSAHAYIVSCLDGTSSDVSVP